MTFGKSVQRTDGLLQLFVDGKKLTYQRKDRLGIMGRDDTLFCSDKQWKTEFRFHGLQDVTDTGLGVPHTFSVFCKISCVGNICEKCIFTDVHKINPSQNKKRTHIVCGPPLVIDIIADKGRICNGISAKSSAICL